MQTEWLEHTLILEHLSDAAKIKLSRLEIFKSIESTNSWLLALAKSGKESGVVCLAEEQTHGRGRQGKVWYSPPATNIYCSVLWRLPAATPDLSTLSLAVGVMVMRALRCYGIEDRIQLKWPNDIYFANRKLAGILIETIAQQDQTLAVVIGIGLNVNLPADNPMQNLAIDLTQMINNPISRNHITGLLLDAIFTALPEFERSGWQTFLQEWRAHDVLLGQHVVIQKDHAAIAGTVMSVNERGELILQDDHGEMQYYHCGEVTVLPNKK